MVIGIDIRPLMEKNRSGVGYYLFYLLDNLFKIDHKNEYKLFFNSFRKVKLPAWNYPNVKFYGYHWPNKILNFSFRFFRWPKVDQLIGGCDVFFIPNLCFLALDKKIKKIITAHDLSYELYPEFLSSKKKWWHYFIQPKKLFSSTERIIAVSENTKQDLVKEYGLEEDKIKVIYSGVMLPPPSPLLASVKDGLAMASPPQAPVRGPFGTGGERLDLPERFILTLGTLEPRKNLVGAIQAFNKLKEDKNFKDWQLVIAGGGGWLNKEVVKMVKDSEFKNDIKVLGYVSEEEKQELYGRAAVFLFPSFYEGFGFPPLEAMMAGCPVITSANSALAEICGGAATLVNPYKIEEVVGAIKDIGNGKREMGNGKWETGEKFDWQRTAREFLNYL